MKELKYDDRFNYDLDYANKFDDDLSKGDLTMESFLPSPETELDHIKVSLSIQNGENYDYEFANLMLFTLGNEFTDSAHTGFAVISLYEVINAIFSNLGKYVLSGKLTAKFNTKKNEIAVEACDFKHGSMFVKTLKDINQLFLKNKAVYSRFYYRHKNALNPSKYVYAFSEYLETLYLDRLQADELDEYTDYKAEYVGNLSIHFFSKFDGANTLDQVVEINQEYNINLNILLQEIDSYMRSAHPYLFDIELSYAPLGLNM